jgi:hypothetical protein
VERLTSGGLRDLLEQAGAALTNGSANVISVSAIRDGSGQRWARKREQVAEFVERAFLRASPGGGFVVGVNDIEYLVVHADTTRWTALNRSAGILRDTLSFFLGQVERQDVRLMEVTGFSNGELAVQSVDPACLAPGADAASPRTGGSLMPPSDRISGGRRARRSRLVAGELEIETSHELQPTWNVRNKTVTSFLVATRTLAAATSQLPPHAAAEVARSSLAFAAEQVHACCVAGAPVALHAPVPIGALAVQAGRSALLSMLKGLPGDVRRWLVLELTDVPEGVPQGRLSEAVAMLAPHARAILARAPSESAALLQWRRCGLNGITLDCGHIEASDRMALTRLSSFARNALALAPACVGYSLGSMSLLVSAWGAGFTHVSGEAVSKEVSELAAVRLPPRELYARAAA